MTNEEKAKISFRIALANLKRQEITVYSDDVRNWKSAALPSVSTRFNSLLKFLAISSPVGTWKNSFDMAYQPFIASDMNPAHPGFGRGEASPMSEVDGYWQHAEMLGYLERKSGSKGREVRLTISGHSYVESLGANLVEGEQIFVAMWFSEEITKPLYECVIEPPIKKAGYIPVRIDDTQHNEMIDNKIIAEIRKSKAVIVDLTCGVGTDAISQKIGIPRGGVYFEAGFATGLNLPVIWMVKDDIADTPNVVHFDVRQFNQIRWNTSNFEKCREELSARIVATLGVGPLVEN
ncbi:hypothetical protein [Palleronia caenipelagi]|uniref:Uncharacterized protein n=1 Tax=Palleronia caenipelagi TaxID=2489174 RepID=A0A547PIS3_9RHOB|nr:hypothetical protein [Palleronia caenipelagi]TRD14048.1 hypothetical protein FEV53_19585 [Palleronia caenipelagi]